MSNDYVERKEFEEAMKQVNDKMDDITDNHLNSIEAWILWLDKSIGNLRWFFTAGMVLLGVVLAILQVFG